MSARNWLWGLMALSSPTLHGQVMSLSNGAVTIAPGTRVALDGPIEWTIGTGGSVVNHGLIDLGAEASLVEPLGNPVTGQGVERASRDLPGAFTDVEPGGLGLKLGMASGIGVVVITRGHRSFRNSLDSASVARWFLIGAAPQPGASLMIGFRYDPTELRGSAPARLVLHKTADTTQAAWAPLESEVLPGLNALSGIDPSPWAFITAFERISTSVPDAPVPLATFLVHPNPATDLLHVSASGDEPLRTIEVLDASGRLVLTQALPHGGSTRATLDVGSLASGILFLRVNGRHVARAVKQ